MIGLTPGLSFVSHAGSVTSPPDLPVSITTRWHPAHSNVTLDGGRVTRATDLSGLADASAPIGLGPTALTDPLGRAFWRFEGDSYLEIADALTLTSRNMSVFFVGRFHEVITRSPVFALGRAQAGAPNTIQSALETAVEGDSIPALRSYSYPRNSNYPALAQMVTGSQMQVVGMVGATSGDSHLWMNTNRSPLRDPYLVRDINGAEIGRYAHRPGRSGTWGRFDLYEMIVVDRAISGDDGDILVADLMHRYGIVPAVNQLVLEGDSIMRGTDPVTSGQAANMVLTDPGAGQIGTDWRVVNLASNGATIAKLRTRRDAPNGWVTTPLPGQNVLAFELGRNDLSSGTQSAATHYANVVDYLSDAPQSGGQNMFAQGWHVRCLVNIASAQTLEAKITAYRALLRDPAFARDTQTDAGGAYAGQMQLVETDLITSGGDLIFATPSDAADLRYYAGDNTHPNATGCALRATGGDTPAHGIAYGL